MSISVIICTNNRYDQLPKAIRSIQNQKPVEGLEAIIVDNSSNAEIAGNFADSYKDVAMLSFVHEAKPGLSNARNVGASLARNEYVAYLDDDAVAAPDWAFQLVEAFRATGPTTAVVGGFVAPMWLEPPPPWLTRRGLDMLSVVDRGPSLRILQPEEWLAGCNIAFRREPLLRLGGFSTGLGRNGKGNSLLGNEEYLICERMRNDGLQVAYAPAARVEHLISPKRVTVEWLMKRMIWQALSDAVSHPDRSRNHANWTKGRYDPIQRRKRWFTYRLIILGLKRRLSDEDLEIIYDYTMETIFVNDSMTN